MSPNKKYEVLQSAEIAGEVREIGAVLELVEADALQFVEAGVIKEVPEGGENDGGNAPTPPVEPPAPEGGEGRGEVPNPNAEPAPAPKEGEQGWAGNHVVGGNENAPLRVPHPDLAGTPAE